MTCYLVSVRDALEPDWNASLTPKELQRARQTANFLRGRITPTEAAVLTSPVPRLRAYANTLAEGISAHKVRALSRLQCQRFYVSQELPFTGDLRELPLALDAPAVIVMHAEHVKRAIVYARASLKLEGIVWDSSDRRPQQAIPVVPDGGIVIVSPTSYCLVSPTIEDQAIYK